MKIKSINPKEPYLKVVPEILDDLWHLEQVIEEGDIVSGITDRKIKGRDDNQKSQRVTLYVSIMVETAAFQEYSGVLKVNGTVTESKPEELAPLKSHQSIDFEPAKEIRIQKKEWKNYQIERLKKAEKATTKLATLLVVFDDETATFGLLKEFDVQAAGSISGRKIGKRFMEKDESKTSYFNDIIQKTKEMKPESIVFAGPGFTKEEFQKYLKEKNQKLANQVYFETTNQTGVTGLSELVKSGTLEKLVHEAQILQDTQTVERFLTEIGRQSGLAEYGFEHVQNAVNEGSVSELLLVDSELASKKKAFENVMKTAENLGAKVHLLHAKTDPGKKILGFGGIVALLRYKRR